MDGRTTPSILRKRARPDAGTWYRAGACMSHVHNVRIFEYAYMIVYNKFSDSVTSSPLAVEAVEAMVRGYHVYHTIRDSTVGEELLCQRETSNPRDPFVVAVIKSSVTIPRIISSVFSVFLRQGGHIRCLVTGSRRYSADLPQGGLEVPHLLIFEGREKDAKRLVQADFTVRKADSVFLKIK